MWLMMEVMSDAVKSNIGSVFHFLNRYLRWLLWLGKSGKSQCREKIMGFGAWHIQFQNLALPFIIGVTLGKLLNMSLSFLNYKIWILAMLEVVIKFIVCLAILAAHWVLTFLSSCLSCQRGWQMQILKNILMSPLP